MKNILRSLLGDKAYKQLLKLIGNGGGGSNNGGNTSSDVRMLVVYPFEYILTTQDGYLYTKMDLSDIPQETLDEITDDINKLEYQIEVNNKIIKFIIDAINDNKVPIVYMKMSYSYGRIMKLYDYMDFPVVDDGGGIKKINDKKSNNTKLYDDDSNDINMYQDGAQNNDKYAIKTVIVDNKLEADEVTLDDPFDY